MIPWAVAHQAPLSMDSPGKNTAVGCHFLLQGIFPTQGINQGLLHCRQTVYHVSHHPWALFNIKQVRWELLHIRAKVYRSYNVSDFLTPLTILGYQITQEIRQSLKSIYLLIIYPFPIEFSLHRNLFWGETLQLNFSYKYINTESMSKFCFGPWTLLLLISLQYPILWE